MGELRFPEEETGDLMPRSTTLVAHLALATPLSVQAAAEASVKPDDGSAAPRQNILMLLIGEHSSSVPDSAYPAASERRCIADDLGWADMSFEGLCVRMQTADPSDPPSMNALTLVLRLFFPQAGGPCRRRPRGVQDAAHRHTRPRGRHAQRLL